ncbi:MAG: response regulator [Candidatus Spechtbacterales bacterium]|nr:response regulator [Candidatus Spechtbacterales bacterium]
MSKKILFIEDEPALQETLTTMLKSGGYEVVSALDGEKGIEFAEKEKPDLIVLDLVLPKKDGFVILEHLKDNEETKNIDVIVLTNLEGAYDIERALNLGAMTYLVKTNHTPEDILKKINKKFET